jgi:hypothetical protein
MRNGERGRNNWFFLPRSSFGMGGLWSHTNGSGHGRGRNGHRWPSGTGHRRPSGHGRAASARRGISSCPLMAATTPRTGENRANQRRHHQESHEHDLIPPPEQRGGRRFPPAPKHTAVHRGAHAALIQRTALSSIRVRKSSPAPTKHQHGCGPPAPLLRAATAFRRASPTR